MNEYFMEQHPMAKINLKYHIAYRTCNCFYNSLQKEARDGSKAAKFSKT